MCGLGIELGWRLGFAAGQCRNIIHHAVDLFGWRKSRVGVRVTYLDDFEEVKATISERSFTHYMHYLFARPYYSLMTVVFQAF